VNDHTINAEPAAQTRRPIGARLTVSVDSLAAGRLIQPG
jgi:hypothetical protein